MTSTPTSHSTSEALGLWEPKRTLTLDAARRHSMRIKIIRRILIAISVIAALLVLWNFNQRSTVVLQEINPTESARMGNPRFSGRTGDGLPYKLTAAQAVRLNNAANEIELENPVLEFFREAGADTSLVLAKSGLYNDVTQVLDLRTDVDLKTDDGNHCITTHARIFTVENRLEGDESIKCDGSFGVITGQTYDIFENYKTFKFKDGMTAQLINENSEDATQDIEFGAAGIIDVKSQEATYRGGTTILIGNVIVSQNDTVIKADKMTIYRDVTSNNRTALKVGEINRIVAEGNFSYTAPQNTVTGDRGVYKRTEKQIDVFGDVRLKQPGGSFVESDSLFYDLENKRARFKNDCKGDKCGKINFTLGNP